MKTLQELYNEVIKSDELKKEYLQAISDKNVGAFMKAHNCDATAEDFKTFLIEQSKANTDKELSVEELENVAGGGCNSITSAEKNWSIYTVGLGCAYDAIKSAISGHVGQDNDKEGRLCSENNADTYNGRISDMESIGDILDILDIF